MIKIEKIETYGWEAAIRGMRNPLNSWSKSDSGEDPAIGFVVGDNDLALMKKLLNAGNDHSKFMRMIGVTMDVTAPLFFWKEADQYKVGTTTNSCSTMHKIHAKEFEVSDFSFEKVLEIEIDSCNNLISCTIEELNKLRNLYNETKDKKYWYGMIQILPSSYNQKRTWSLNYAVLQNIYHARKDHKLDEWKVFCRIIKNLPYSELITGEEE